MCPADSLINAKLIFNDADGCGLLTMIAGRCFASYYNTPFHILSLAAKIWSDREAISIMRSNNDDILRNSVILFAAFPRTSSTQFTCIWYTIVLIIYICLWSIWGMIGLWKFFESPDLCLTVCLCLIKIRGLHWLKKECRYRHVIRETHDHSLHIFNFANYLEVSGHIYM